VLALADRLQAERSITFDAVDSHAVRTPRRATRSDDPGAVAPWGRGL
jgi:hypothetical protein